MTTPTYLVLGSTGGVGLVLCERLAKRGASLVRGGRDPAKLNELDGFYRHVRRETVFSMSGRKPLGGRLSFDTETRRPWRGDPPAPRPPRYPIERIKQEVIEFVESDFAERPGRLEPRALASTAKDAERAWRWAQRLGARESGRLAPNEAVLRDDPRVAMPPQGARPLR